MSNSYFQFKQFIIQQDRCAMKVTTDACLFGAWVADSIKNERLKMDTCIDVGTGTGLLSLMLAQKNGSSLIDAIEIDETACRQAEENVNDSPFTDRINILCDDVRTYRFKKKYDLIICNPPFYENEVRSGDHRKNVAHHNEGLLLSELMSLIKLHLAPGGNFYLLLPYKRSNEIKSFFVKHEFSVSQMTLVRQSINHDYFRIMISGQVISKEPVKTILNEISIWNEEQQYTDEFTKLLRDYYLFL